MNNQCHTLFEGEYIRLRRCAHWEYAERHNISGIVGIVAVTPEGRLLLVEQYRYPVARNVIELPAGLAGDSAKTRGEALAAAAHRELLEETGYAAERMTFLTEGPPSSGMSNEIISLFLAEGLRQQHAGGGDDSEELTIHTIPLPEVHTWLEAQRRQGRLIDLRIYTALFFLSQQAKQ
jgi:ADP-ribose pyrophosphatase